MQTSKSWSVTTRYFILILILGFLLWLVVAGHELIGPLAISALLAYVINPAVIFVNERTKLSRPWVVALVYLVFLAVLIVVGVLVAPVLPSFLSGVVAEIENIIVQVELVLSRPISLLNMQIPVEELLATLPTVSASFASADVVLGVVQATTTNIAWVLIVVVTTYYLLLDWVRLREWLLGLVPQVYQGDARRLYYEVRVVWQRYLRGQLRLMFLMGLITGVASAAIGLPGAVALGVLAGLLDVILTVGPTVVTLIAAIVAYLSGSTFLPISNIWFAVLTVAVYVGIQTLENIWLRPRIMGHTLRLHPALVFVGVIGSLALAGVLTALVIVPLMGSVLVVGRYLYCKILDIDPWLDEDVALYSGEEVPEQDEEALELVPARGRSGDAA